MYLSSLLLLFFRGVCVGGGFMWGFSMYCFFVVVVLGIFGVFLWTVDLFSFLL